MKPVEVEYPDWNFEEEDTFTDDFTSADVKRGFNREPLDTERRGPRRSVEQRSYGKECVS